VRDVSHRKAREDRLAVEADTDPLTGLLNRRAFARCVKDEAVDLEGYCLAMFDIDRFKLVNDRYGHAAGDEVLKTFARVACHTIRDGDRIGRLGGEEFAILLKTATHDEAIIVCERLRKTVAAASTAFGQHEITVTVSGGIAAFGSRTDLDEVLTLADTALYRAKRSGRNQLALAA
jgi:diguanylate cyclase (GGDEF)-like protein